MKKSNNIIIVRQLDARLANLRLYCNVPIPAHGWIRLLRQAFNMSLSQLGKRLQMTPQGIRDIERRELTGAITLKALKEAGEALGMHLVYGFVPKNGSLEEMIEQKAHEVAEKIVKRTSITMRLEDQENSQERLKQAIDELAAELKKEMPKSLWD